MEIELADNIKIIDEILQSKTISTAEKAIRKLLEKSWQWSWLLIKESNKESDNSKSAKPIKK